jgi:hypothetical protein
VFVEGRGVYEGRRGELVAQLGGQTPGATPRQGAPRLEQARQEIEAMRMQLQDEIELLEAQVKVKHAELAEGEAKIKQAQRNLERLNRLGASGAISQEELAKAKDDLEIVAAQMEPKRAQLHEAEVRLMLAQKRLERLQASGGLRAGDQPKVAPEVLGKRRAAGEPVGPVGAMGGQNRARARAELLKKLLESDKEGKLTDEMKQTIFMLFEQERAAQVEAQRAMAESERAKAEQAKAHAERADLERRAAAALGYRGQEKVAEDKLAAAKKAAAVDGQADVRLKQLEMRIDQLAREMELLRKELKSQPPRSAK